jgi:hypothetical protein
MSFDRGRVERQRDGIFPKLGQRFKDGAPSSALGPTIEAIVDGRVRAVFARTIAPSRTRLQHMNDTADDAPIIVPLRTSQPLRQMRFNACPLPVIQPKQTITHSLAPESTQRPENHTALIRYRPKPGLKIFGASKPTSLIFTPLSLIVSPSMTQFRDPPPSHIVNWALTSITSVGRVL